MTTDNCTISRYDTIISHNTSCIHCTVYTLLTIFICQQNKICPQSMFCIQIYNLDWSLRTDFYPAWFDKNVAFEQYNKKFLTLNTKGTCSNWNLVRFWKTTLPASFNQVAQKVLRLSFNKYIVMRMTIICEMFWLRKYRKDHCF